MNPIEALLTSQMTNFVLVLSRVSGLIIGAPIFGSSSVPVRIRALLAIALSLLIAPLYTPAPSVRATHLPGLLTAIGGELVIGLGLGLGIMILLAGIQLAGQIISQQSGTALADVFQPGFDANVPLFSQLLIHVATAVLIVSGGYRMVMAALLDTFHALPPGGGLPTASVTDALMAVLSQSFVLGIRTAAPVMTALLLSTLVLGLISRTLPQINILAVGFGINSMVTFGALLIALGALAWTFQEEVQPALDLITLSLQPG